MAQALRRTVHLHRSKLGFLPLDIRSSKPLKSSLFRPGVSLNQSAALTATKVKYTMESSRRTPEEQDSNEGPQSAEVLDRTEHKKDDPKVGKRKSDEDPLTKTQLKKKRRYEMKMEQKKRNKEKRREARRAKAIAEGRDLEEERRIQEERTKSGEGWKRRQEQWLSRMKTADNSFRVCIDCAYEDQMVPKEINSLASQIRYCYAQNKRSKKPCYLSVSSLASNGETRGHLEKVAGFPEQWFARAFKCSENSLTDIHPQKEKLVYLTSDSENTLEHLEDDKIYVIGGIVDRNRLQRAAITRAEELGVATAKLPITQYLQLFTTKVLTCNHVFEILLKYREHGNDWKKAMLDVLPTRKDVKPLEDDGQDAAPEMEETAEEKDDST